MITRLRAEAVAERLRDERSRRVAFVSHCLLNENVRYLGGAFRRGPVAEVIDRLAEDGVGICQMPCPEQHAWGGVLKRWLLLAYGARRSRFYRFRGLLLRLFLLHTRIVYRRLACDVVEQIADYHDSGFTVVGIIGVASSPSCGVNTTLDIRNALEAMARMPIDELDRRSVNYGVVLASRRAGTGIFIDSLQRRLRRRGLDVPLLEHDLVAEMPADHRRPPDGENQEVQSSSYRP